MTDMRDMSVEDKHARSPSRLSEDEHATVHTCRKEARRTRINHFHGVVVEKEICERARPSESEREAERLSLAAPRRERAVAATASRRNVETRAAPRRPQRINANP